MAISLFDVVLRRVKPINHVPVIIYQIFEYNFYPLAVIDVLSRRALPLIAI